MFCRHCGTQLQAGASFCSNCGAARRREDSVPPPAPAVPASSRPALRKPLKGRIMDSMLIPVAIILILMGIGSMALSVVGRATTAQVIGYEQVLFINNDDSTRNPSRYKLEYQFSVNGERYTGSVTRVFPGGSHMRNTISVRYLSFWPHANTEERDMNSVGPVTLGGGALVLALGVRKKLRNSYKNRKVVC